MARASSSERSTRGVRMTSSSVREADWVWVPNNAPSTGMAESKGRPALELLALSLMRPPSTRVSPERTATLESIWRCMKVG